MLKVLITQCLAFFLCIWLPAFAQNGAILTINILSRDVYNEAGKEIDASILKKELETLGHCVHVFDYLKNTPITPADINIFLAQFKPRLFAKAKLNWFIPNAEFCRATLDDLQAFDLILCKTKEALRIFTPISKKTYDLGFTSLDCHLPSTSKSFNKLLHLAGKSVMKGTKEVLRTWKNHPELPKLILIKREAYFSHLPNNVKLITERLPRSSLLKMENSCGLHLCPSKTEGFGHYIMEAMSTEAVVVTTDAPPMNEFIKDKRCLIPYHHTSTQQYATLYMANEEELVRVVKALQALPIEELQEIGRRNREEYLKRDAIFKENFRNLMLKTAQALYP